jgi:hypothetical protein
MPLRDHSQRACVTGALSSYLVRWFCCVFGFGGFSAGFGSVFLLLCRKVVLWEPSNSHHCLILGGATPSGPLALFWGAPAHVSSHSAPTASESIGTSRPTGPSKTSMKRFCRLGGTGEQASQGNKSKAPGPVTGGVLASSFDEEMQMRDRPPPPTSSEAGPSKRRSPRKDPSPLQYAPSAAASIGWTRL